MTSTWSTIPDGLGYYYGYVKGDSRQMNVRCIVIVDKQSERRQWECFVGGDYIGEACSLTNAQTKCERYIRGDA